MTKSEAERMEALSEILFQARSYVLGYPEELTAKARRELIDRLFPHGRPIAYASSGGDAK